MQFFKKTILLLSIFIFFVSNPALSTFNFDQKFYLIYKQGQLIGISKGITNNNIEKCKTILLKKQEKQNFSVSNFISETIFKSGKKNTTEIIKHTIESETDSGKIVSTIEKKNNQFISTTIIPKKKNIIKKTKVPNDIKIFNNNIYYQLEKIVSDFIANSYNDFKKEIPAEKNLNIFIPAFMKSKKINLKFITKNQIIAKIDQQIILININFKNTKQIAEIESFLFPLQLFEVIPCNKEIFDFAESNIIKKIKFNLINPTISGPAKFNISNFQSYNPDEIGSYFYTSFLADQKNIMNFKINNKSYEKIPLFYKIIESYKLFDNFNSNKKNLSINQNSILKDYVLFFNEKFVPPDYEKNSYRNAWGFILLGTKNNKFDYTLGKWIEIFESTQKNWLPADPFFRLHPSRYIRISENSKNIMPHLNLKSSWFNNPWNNKIKFSYLPADGVNSSYILSINNKEIGVSAFAFKRNLNFLEKKDMLIGNASVFYSLNVLHETQNNKDKYKTSFAMKSTSVYNHAEIERINIKVLSDSLGIGFHNLKIDNIKNNHANLIANYQKMPEKIQLTAKNFNIVINPLNILHWQMLIYNTIGINKIKKKYLFTSLNPLSIGKGLLTGLDIFFYEKTKKFIKAKSNIYNISFLIDSNSLLINEFLDHNSRIAGKICNYKDFEEKAKKISAHALFNTTEIGIQK